MTLPLAGCALKNLATPIKIRNIRGKEASRLCGAKRGFPKVLREYEKYC